MTLGPEALAPDGSVPEAHQRPSAAASTGDGPADSSAPSDQVTFATEPLPSAPSPYASLSARPGRIVGQAFDVLTRANSELRRASFYVGLLVMGTFVPFVLLVWRVQVEVESRTAVELFDLAGRGLDGYIYLTTFIAIGGVAIANVESQAVAAVILASRLGERRLDLKAAIERSRQVFWRIVRMSILINIPLFLLQSFLQGITAGLFGGTSEISVLSAAILATIVATPAAFALTGIVLGDVGAVEALRRSVRLFRAGKLTALVVGLFAFGAQFLTAFAVAEGLDLTVRATNAIGIASGASAISAAIVAALIVVLTFALGTLVFTVAAISLAPQVVTFLALTHADPGLREAQDAVASSHGRGRFRWLTRGFLALMAFGAFGLIAGLVTLAG